MKEVKTIFILLISIILVFQCKKQDAIDPPPCAQYFDRYYGYVNATNYTITMEVYDIFNINNKFDRQKIREYQIEPRDTLEIFLNNAELKRNGYCYCIPFDFFGAYGESITIRFEGVNKCYNFGSRNNEDSTILEQNKYDNYSQSWEDGTDNYRLNFTINEEEHLAKAVDCQ